MSLAVDTILFDLDGTLLPMEQTRFTEVYFRELQKFMARHGYAPERVTEAVWAGTEAMVKNDGGETNETVFWSLFARLLGDEVLAMQPELEKFYEVEFNNARHVTDDNPLAAELVRELRGAGCTLVLASNPVFPLRAYRTRGAWVGLDTERDFDLVTDYSRFHHCKPNPGYYREILEQLGKAPEQCLMVGNDVREDGLAAGEAGIDAFIVTDCLIEDERVDVGAFRHGSFDALRRELAGIAARG